MGQISSLPIKVSKGSDCLMYLKDYSQKRLSHEKGKIIVSSSLNHKWFFLWSWGFHEWFAMVTLQCMWAEMEVEGLQDPCGHDVHTDLNMYEEYCKWSRMITFVSFSPSICYFQFYSGGSFIQPLKKLFTRAFVTKYWNVPPQGCWVILRFLAWMNATKLV